MREHENLSDKKAKAMINELLELQAEQVKNKRVFIKKFSEKLAPKKVLQYFVLEEIISSRPLKPPAGKSKETTGPHKRWALPPVPLEAACEGWGSNVPNRTDLYSEALHNIFQVC